MPPIAELEFRILGPLEVFAAGSRVPVPKGKSGALLADLIAHVDETVSAERLIRDLWDSDEPANARAALQVYVSQLRRLLEDEPRHPRVLLTEGNGYRLRIERKQLDAARFERLAQQGRQALEAGAHAIAADKFDEALQEWRGLALADFRAQAFAQTRIVRLEDMRVQALEDRVEARLALGRHAEVIAELRGHVQEHPLRERLRAQLMLALYRAGRQADALEEYRSARAALVEQAGLEPSASLRELEAAILRQEESLTLKAPVARAAARTGELSPLDVSQRLPVDSPTRPDAAVRKTVTVLVSELVRGPESLDPELVEALITRYRELVRTSVERYGGTVDSYAGDSVVAVFGVPFLHEDDPFRCVQAALEIERAIPSLADHVGPEVTIGARLGAETGTVVATTAGVGQQIAGEVQSVATQLARGAAPRDLIVGAELASQLLGRARTTRTDVDGRVAWRVESLRDLTGGAEEEGRTKFVGREAELHALRETFDAVLNRRACRLALLVGAAGVGKSRLGREFRRDVEGEATIIVGHCLPYGEGLALGPVREIVTQLAGDPPELMTVLRGTDDASLIAARVSAALGFSGDQAVSDDTFWALRKLFEARARGGPLVLLFEDLHWAKPRFLDFVEHLVDWSRDAPLLLIGLARNELLEQRPAWAAPRETVMLLPVEPLSDSHAEELAAHVRASAALDELTIADIVSRAEGNPLFLEQMLEFAHVGEVPGQLKLPPTIAGVLAARLDALPALERALISHAAVIGRTFGPRQLEALLPAPGLDRGSALDALVRKSFIEPHGPTFAGPDAYRFRHALIVEVAYDSLSKRDRSELHERLADWIERADELGPDARAELAGHHLERAYEYCAAIGPADERAERLATRAGERLAEAARRAVARDLREAEAALLRRAIDVLPRSNRLRLELLPELAEALTTTGDLDGAQMMVAEARQLIDSDAAPLLDAYTRLIETRVRMRTDPSWITTQEILDGVDRVIAVLDAQPGQELRISSAWALRGFTCLLAGLAGTAEEAAVRAAEYARRVNDVRGEVRASNLLFGAMLLGPMHAAEAFRRCEENVPRVAGIRWAHSSAHVALALLSAMQDHATAARRHLSLHEQLMEDLGQPVLFAAAGEMRGRVALLLGDRNAAEHEFRAGCEALQEMGERGYSAQLAALLADILCTSGSYDEARELVEAHAAHAGPDFAARIAWLGVRAKLNARDGSSTEAERLANDAVALAADTDYLNYHADARVTLAEILTELGRPVEAVSELTRAVALYNRKGNIVSAREVRGSIDALRRQAGP
jgi:DNA-binding SARP family transcriptional activator